MVQLLVQLRRIQGIHMYMLVASIQVLSDMVLWGTYRLLGI